MRMTGVVHALVFDFWCGLIELSTWEVSGPATEPPSLNHSGVIGWRRSLRPAWDWQLWWLDVVPPGVAGSYFLLSAESGGGGHLWSTTHVYLYRYEVYDVQACAVVYGKLLLLLLLTLSMITLIINQLLYCIWSTFTERQVFYQYITVSVPYWFNSSLQMAYAILRYGTAACLKTGKVSPQ